MGLRGNLAFVSASLAVAAACSTFDEAPSEPAIDAGPDSPAPVPADATSSVDAGSDAWVPCLKRDADPSHFCDDFDRQGAIDFDWDLRREADGTVAFFEGGTSLPNSFLSSIPTGNPPGRAQLIHKSAPPASTYRLEFDVRVDAIPHPMGNTGYSHLAVIEFDDAPCPTGSNSQRSIELSMYAFDTSVKVFEKGMKVCPGGDAAIYGTEDGFAITPTQLADGQFRHVTITLAKGSCPGTDSKMSLYATLGDLSTKCRGFDIDVFAGSTKMWTYVGAYVGSAAFESTAYVYDNVTIDQQ